MTIRNAAAGTMAAFSVPQPARDIRVRLQRPGTPTTHRELHRRAPPIARVVRARSPLQPLRSRASVIGTLSNFRQRHAVPA